MDITTNLDDFVSYNPETATEEDFNNYKTYIIKLIEETINNYINVDKLFFDKNTNRFDFKSLVGETSAKAVSDLQLFLNVQFRTSFDNLALNILKYTFTDDIENNQLILELTVTCGLLGLPKNMVYKIPIPKGA